MNDTPPGNACCRLSRVSELADRQSHHITRLPARAGSGRMKRIVTEAGVYVVVEAYSAGSSILGGKQHVRSGMNCLSEFSPRKKKKKKDAPDENETTHNSWESRQRYLQKWTKRKYPQHAELHPKHPNTAQVATPRRYRG